MSFLMVMRVEIPLFLLSLCGSYDPTNISPVMDPFRVFQ